MTREEAVAFLETLEATDEIKNPLGLVESLRKANDEAKTHREALEEANEKIAGLESFQTGSLDAAALRELKAEGIPEKFARIIDKSKISFNSDGTLSGYAEEVESKKTEWPELVDKKRNAPNVDQFQREEPTEKLSATQIQLARLREAHNA